MAIYTFYDTDSALSIQEIDNNNALVSLWGSIPQVRWLTISSAQLTPLHNVNMLEITLFNLMPVANVGFSFLARNLTPPELTQRENRKTNSSKEQMIVRLLREGNGARFKFRLHSDSVKTITDNFTNNLEFTLGLFEGKLCLFVKAPIVNQAIIAFAITNPSGGVKIPRGQ